jgi:hypothetical protein
MLLQKYGICPNTRLDHLCSAETVTFKTDLLSLGRITVEEGS